MNNIEYIFIPVGAIISFISIKGVIKSYARDYTFKQRQKYGNDVLGMVVGILMFVVGILKILGFEIN